MKQKSHGVALYGLLVALMLVLGLLGKAIPITWFLSGAIPGIKLGLANTVLLYALYLMNWRSAALLMVVKAVLSGFIYGSVTAIAISLSGGVLSLLVMLAVKRGSGIGALAVGTVSLAGEVWLLCIRRVPLRGDMLWCVAILALACVGGFAVWLIDRRGPGKGVIATSMAGGVCFNIGQTLMAVVILRTPQLLYGYLPFLVGMGAVVGCLTGVVAQRVFLALKAVDR